MHYEDNNQSKSEIRDSNFELLRIIAMLMIIAYHYVIHGQAELIANGDLYQRTFLEAYSMFGKIGVNLFVLISGFFGVSKVFKYQKVLKLEMQCLFFSWGFLVLYSMIGKSTPTAMNIFSGVFPVINNQYWFVTAYVVLYIFSPWYNRLLMGLTQEEYKRLLLLFALVWSIIPCVSMHTYDGMNWSQQIWMFVMYAFGGYINRFGIKIAKERIYLIILVLALLTSVLAAELLGIRVTFFRNYATYFRWSNTLIAFPASILIFDVFRRKTIGKIKSINFIGGAAFSVYLVHENPFFQLLYGKEFVETGMDGD